MNLRPPGAIRIIGGRWKRTPLPVPDRPGLRPTPNRVRETLFNWLGQDLQGWTVLDAFAGSGALGFEAASRGAAAVTLLEQDRDLARALSTTRSRLKADELQVVCTEALAWMARCPHHFDLIFLDPPFGADLFDAALDAAQGLLNPGGWVYLEADRSLDTIPEGLTLERQGRAGAVHFHLLRAAPAKLDRPTRGDAP